MIDETIQRIEARLRSAETMPDSTRMELLTLLQTLRAEVSQLPPGKAAEAQSIALAADRSTEQALAPDRDPDVYRGTLDTFSGSVREFEESHPKLVQIVNNIANTLAGLGI
jgi:hypothetical protein